MDGGGLGGTLLVVDPAAVGVLVPGPHRAHPQARRIQLQVEVRPLAEHGLVAPVSPARLSQVVAARERQNYIALGSKELLGRGF